MSSIKSFDGTEVCYSVYKTEKNREAVLLLPGFAMDHTLWCGFDDYFKDQYNLILIDYRGSGLNSGSAPSDDIEVLTNDIRLILEKEGLERVNIVGHSMGGFVAQYLAAVYPSLVQKIVLLNSYYKSLSNQLLGYDVLLDLIGQGVNREALIKQSLPSIYGSKFLDLDSNISTHVSRMANRKYPMSLDAINAQIKLIKRFNFSEKVKDLSSLFIVAGEEDRVFPLCYAENFQKKAKGAKLYVVKNAGHMTHYEAPKEVFNVIQEFIKDD